MQQDAAYGIRQIVDIALKALSPGVNDTTTAIICVDFLGAILARLASLKVEAAHRSDGRELRLIARGASFQKLLGEAFDQIGKTPTPTWRSSCGSSASSRPS